MKIRKTIKYLAFPLFIALYSIFSYGQEPQKQGFIQTSHGDIWYHMIGDTSLPTILTLHGGPGGTCYSLYPLTALAESYRIILFDQPGGGRSYRFSDTTMMTMDFFVDQLHEFIAELGLGNYILYGHSWGTMLAIDYYLKYPEGISALILNSPLVSTHLWELDADTLLLSLPDSLQEAVAFSERTMNFDTKGYHNAIATYYRQYISRNKRISTIYDVGRKPGNNLIYNYMWGPSEFTATGTLKSYDRLNMLKEIKIPTLWITGEYDEARPGTVHYYSSLTPKSRFAIIDDAAHATMHDNPEENIRIILEFLTKDTHVK